MSDPDNLYCRLMDAGSGGNLPNMAAARALINEATGALSRGQDEIKRLRVENAELQRDLDNASAWLADIYRMTDGEIDQYLEGYDV